MFIRTLRTPKGLRFKVWYLGFTPKQHVEAVLKGEFVMQSQNKDLDELSGFIYNLIPSFGPKNEIRESLNSLYGLNLTIYHKEKRIGFVCTYFIYLPSKVVVRVILYIGIIPSQRNKGFASTFLKKFYQDEDILLTFVTGDSTLFWEKNGFRKLIETNLNELKEKIILENGEEMIERFYVRALK